MSANKIMIINIDIQFTPEYIANAFWSKEIAKVSSVTLIPQINDVNITNIAYVNFHSFCETEAAFDFIEGMKCDGFMFGYDNQNNWWLLEKNTHNDGNLSVGPYTTKFAVDHFKPIDDENDENMETDEYVMDDEDWEEFIRHRPIKGLNNVYYTVEGALEELSCLIMEMEHKLYDDPLATYQKFVHLKMELYKCKDESIPDSLPFNRETILTQGYIC